MALYQHISRDGRPAAPVRRTLVALACAASVTFTANHAGAQVTVNGNAVPKASSSIDSTQDVIELREGGGSSIQLVASLRRFAVCVIAPTPIAVLDAELPLANTPSRFVVQVEDGRQFSQCLLTSLKADGSGGKRRLNYCLRCENVTTP